MHELLLLNLVMLLALGIGAQCLAWHLRVPSILLLLLVGIGAGAGLQLISPDAMLGELLFPLVSLSVAVILFEGGMSLRFREFTRVGAIVRNLVTIGVILSWLLTTLAAHFILGMDLLLALLFGAILVVTGPTVIIPLLRQVRPHGRVGEILKWEGILIDPIGAILAVIVFEVVFLAHGEVITLLVVSHLVLTILAGCVVGIAGVAVFVLLLRQYWIPDYLHSPVALMLVGIVYTLSHLWQAESGLLAVTVMGIALANQRFVNVTHIMEFKENLRVILIALLFMLLAARLTWSDLTALGPIAFLFLAALILVVRPFSVWFSTWNTTMAWRERLFLFGMAPRGIVAAAVASVFALRLETLGVTDASALVPLTFLVIIGTVVLYGLSAVPFARWLGVAQPHPQGILVAGAHDWARQIASVLKRQCIAVQLVDTNYGHVSAARLAGLPAVHASILSDFATEQMDLGGLGRLLALTSNDEVNTLAAQRFVRVFDQSELYTLVSKGEGDTRMATAAAHQRGRTLFAPELSYQALETLFADGAQLKATTLTDEFDYLAFQQYYGPRAVPLFLLPKPGQLQIITAGVKIAPQPGTVLISLVTGEKAQSAAGTPEPIECINA